MTKIIGMDGLTIVKAYVNASYAVYHDMRGHNGGLITVGKRVIHIKTNTQKLNTKSSTGNEVEAASDYMPWTIWITNELFEQGYAVKTIFYQDNERAIKIERYVLKSCGYKSRYIYIRYFLLKIYYIGENQC